MIYRNETMFRSKDIQDIYPLSPMQEGLFFHSLVDKTSNDYFVQISYRIRGDLDIMCVQKSLQVLVRRHDILRTVFNYKKKSQQILQVVLKDRDIDFSFVDLGNAEYEDRVRLVDLHRHQERMRAFDLTKDVLMRVSVLRTGLYNYEFIWSYHHILMDGWCLGILTDEYSEIYNSFLQNRSPSLSSVRPYKNFIQWLSAQDSAAAALYWQHYLNGYNHSCGLP